MTRADAIQRQDRPTRDPQVAFVVLDGESVLFHEGLGRAHLFNPTATLIWTELDGERDVATLIRGFVEMTGGPAAVIERDVLAALQQFADLGLLAGIAPDPDREPATDHEEENP